ncbi:MAG: LysE family transporter, partial [Ginsengibacter sp.]
MRLVKIFFWGLIISFLGSLPLGTLNVAAMQISVQESIRNAVYFSLGSLLVEMVYVRISLVGINWVRKQKRIFRWMEWIALLIVIALAVGSFVAAMQPQHAKNIMLNNNINRFFLGV